MHIVITNGPPFSGKDTAVKHLLKRFPNAIWMRFKDVLYKETWKDLWLNTDGTEELSLDEWIEICNDVVLKDTPMPWNITREEMLNWMKNPELFSSPYVKTPRQELIDKSEKEIKVKHGEAGVAVITAGYMKEYENWKDQLFIFSDGGFNVEIGALCEELDITKDQMTIVRLDAEGCSFNNDSREYIENPDIRLYNDKTYNFLKDIDERLVPMIQWKKLVIKTSDNINELLDYAHKICENKKYLYSKQDKHYVLHNYSFDQPFEVIQRKHDFNTNHILAQHLKSGEYRVLQWTNTGVANIVISELLGTYCLAVSPLATFVENEIHVEEEKNTVRKKVKINLLNNDKYKFSKEDQYAEIRNKVELNRAMVCDHENDSDYHYDQRGAVNIRSVRAVVESIDETDDTAIIRFISGWQSYAECVDEISVSFNYYPSNNTIIFISFFIN